MEWNPNCFDSFVSYWFISMTCFALIQTCALLYFPTYCGQFSTRNDFRTLISKPSAAPSGTNWSNTKVSIRFARKISLVENNSPEEGTSVETSRGYFLYFRLFLYFRQFYAIFDTNLKEDATKLFLGNIRKCLQDWFSIWYQLWPELLKSIVSYAQRPFLEFGRRMYLIWSSW